MKFIKANVNKDKKTGCWNWSKSKNSAGYGQFQRDGKYWLTHRFVVTETQGPIPSNHVVRHMCHNPACCNPKHLKTGTGLDNYNDSREVHLRAAEKIRKKWTVNGVTYNTVREAVQKTGLSQQVMNKYTNKDTRIFDVESYREGCRKSNRWKPKV